MRKSNSNFAAFVRAIRAVATTLCVSVLCATPAPAQRVAFPTMVAQGDGGFAASAQPLPNSGTPGAGSWTTPTPGTSPLTPLQPPGVTLRGTLAPATPDFDPYAPAQVQPPGFTPGLAPYNSQAPSPYAPLPGGATMPDALYPGGYPGGSPYMAPQASALTPLGAPLRFIQQVRGSFSWLPARGSRELGVTELELSTTATFPIFTGAAPFLITPGFGVTYLDGPLTEAPSFADMPARVYDAYLDIGWNPQLNPWLGVQLNLRGGVFSDFQFFDTQAVRIMGRGLVVISLKPDLQVTAGIIYLDRNEIKMLPAGGVIWTPNQDARYEIVFPDPKLARRVTTVGTVDVWMYIAGELGGGSWAIERLGGAEDSVDYNDLRAIFGIETVALSGLKGNLEIGYVFNRELLYTSNLPNKFEPSDTVMIRAMLAY